MSQYSLYIWPSVQDEVKRLPGHMRQRVRRAVSDLASDPRPPASRRLRIPGDTSTDRELRRLRLGNWRIVYRIYEADRHVVVMAVRQRPPYDYDDLESMLDDDELT